ncbi:glutaredoxin-like protein NrdH [Bifidobacterium sp. ESL0800]|uniref:glutaredoxin-like protein NrdH n=1 Tax=Bifidobacterium sp. ESL0800 TaxID=2983236 RepID=UPI0023F82C83|nr:glutaredoxin-like protein NrdH [Bifidobacterium sp. ESL0800]WEV75308.1 glutaredoxin-like protein NrdH [Bifidobacterium sp. ESL0800]
MTVTVFTKPRCPQCEATKRQLKRQGIAFETVDLTENPSTLEQITQAGFRQAPVVITPDASWSGYRPDLIKQLAAGAVKISADAKTQQTVLA